DDADPLGLSRYRDLFGPLDDAVETPNRDPIGRRGVFDQRTSADGDGDDASNHATARDPGVADVNDVTADRATGHDAADIDDAVPRGDAGRGSRDDVGHATSERALIEAAAARPAVDDFTRITGVGPKSAAALVAAGIRTYDQLADTMASRLAD